MYWNIPYGIEIDKEKVKGLVSSYIAILNRRSLIRNSFSFSEECQLLEYFLCKYLDMKCHIFISQENIYEIIKNNIWGISYINTFKNAPKKRKKALIKACCLWFEVIRRKQ